MRILYMVLFFMPYACISCLGGSNSGMQATQSEWVVTWGGRGGDIIWDIKVKEEGSIYVAGSYYDECRFQKNGTVYLDVPDFKSNIIFAVFSLEGLNTHLFTSGDSGTDDGKSIAIDDNGNIFFSGLFSESVDLRPGVLSSICTNDPENGYSSFIVKYRANNSYEWSRCFQTGRGVFAGEPACVFDMAVRDKHLYVVGYFSGSTDFDPTPDVDEHHSEGLGDIFISKYGIDGSYIWSKTIGGKSDYDLAEAIDVDQSGNLYICGSIGYDEEGVDMDPGPNECFINGNTSPL